MSSQAVKLGLAALAGGAAVYLIMRKRTPKSAAPQFPASKANPPLLNANPLPALRHDSIVTTIGGTPLIKLNKILLKYGVQPGVNVYAKFEAMNPGGSIKDRLAIGAIEWAEVNGELKPGQTVIELTSGNTGIGLAVVCAAKGYPLVCVLPENASIERRKILRFFGAKVLTTNPMHKSMGMLQVIKRLVEKKGMFWPMQFANDANAWIHRRTTGPEILEAMGDDKVDHLFVPWGTGGTIKGLGMYFKEYSPHTEVVVCEPDTNMILSSGIKSTWSDDYTMVYESHKRMGTHLFQGWGPDFVSPLVEQARGLGVFDRVEARLPSLKGLEVATDLAQLEGIFTGPSGGGSVLAALLQAKVSPPGTNIVVTVADTGERYLSTTLFEEIAADMSEEEKQLVADGDGDKTTRPPMELTAASDAARVLVQTAIKNHKLLTFGFQNCEFCWTVKKFFKAIGIEDFKFDFDSAEYLEYEHTLRAAIEEASGQPYFPAIFIDGKFFGGAFDMCKAWKDGSFQKTLMDAGVVKHCDENGCVPKFAQWNGYKGDPFEFLPKWFSMNPLRAK